MDFSLSEEQILIQQTAQHFAQQELAPIAADIDQHRQHNRFLDNLKQLAELGFMGLGVNSQYGGSEAGTVAFSLAITELAKACAATATTTSVTNMVAEVIQAIGNEAQKQRYLPKICSGEYAAASFCLTEPQAGSDPAAMQTKAVKQGKGWRLNGSKLYITSALYAGVFVVWAVTDPNAPKGKGISCFLVEAGSKGLDIAPPEKKMGQHGSYTSVVSFNDCHIPHSALLGSENSGYRIAVAELAGGRIGIGSLALGIGLAAMDYAKHFMTEREQFGQKIGHFQGLQWMLADSYTELEAARLLLMQAASLKQQGQPFATQAAMAKLYASEKANHACYTALQLLGGAGYLQDHPLERMSRDVRLTTIYEGTSEIQRLIIARDLLKEIL
ncbi:acyl-CoA dehydrogenase family protein [Dasania sp. GY-MA-18]|uniref:3-sulfinopropanoyl-CoA desulfinase n=1 Tax=Dasania phycosphaerae TaxID=2950436 RepID=A0A9J6RIF9_9GAMM|nr:MULTISPECIES: acyl-CoA dehydrogenase family protein [Dasania]MCR8921345.1 acyl-CoA dehydrogenase family protein [Dasania sp. GY-MA-18]MCZ0863773.1 acyl-CoA dehydrogenase family protein [Dasania phycosphaerae]MCZ0867501.1 acyl-CoA dehydrogenase family protein [Dasania phycosphaerae]